MTTPRVVQTYFVVAGTSFHNREFAELTSKQLNSPLLELILLSDHKEVVKEIYGRLSEAVNQIAADNVLEGKIDELEALVKRQALAIEKLKEQRNKRITAGHDPAITKLWVAEADAEITAILQEAK